MEKFTICNEDEFQRLRKLVEHIESLVDTETHFGRRRYPMYMYMDDTKVSCFLYGNKDMYRIDVLTNSNGTAHVSETLGHCIKDFKNRADAGDLSNT